MIGNIDIITPDISATVRIDLRRIKLEADRLAVLGVSDEHADARARACAEIDDVISKLPAGGPVAVIGYIPAAKRTSLLHRQFALQRSQAGDWTSDAMDDGTEITRDWVRWGLKDHTLGTLFLRDAVDFRGEKHAVASSAMIDLYERNGLLYALRSCIEEYNDLSAEKKTPSLLSAGTVQEISVATSASKNQS